MTVELKARLNGADFPPGGIAATDRGLTLGDGLFETIAVSGGRPVWLEEHLARLAASAETMGIACDRGFVTREVAVLLTDVANGILRITLTRGSGGRGLGQGGADPTLLLTLNPWAPDLAFAPARLITSTVCRNAGSPAARMKTLSCADNILAAREAVAADVDDALMLNAAGHIACSTIANVFVLRSGALLTPPLSDGVLPGIVRGQLVAEFGARESTLRPADLHAADAVFLTNSLRLLRPVTQLDGNAMSQAARVGQISAWLAQASGL